MKKLIIILLLVALTLGGCTIVIDDGDVKSTTKRPSVTTARQTQEPSVTTTVTEAPAETTSVVPAGSLPRGTWSNNQYTNSYVGLTFTLPPEWRVMSDQELADKMGVALEIFAGDTITLDQLSVSTLYDMMAMDDSTGDNVIIMYENLEATGGLDYSMSEYMSNLTTQLEATGIYSSIGTPYETSIGGRVFMAQPLESSAYNLTQTYYLCRKDKVMLAVIITAVSTDVSTIFSYLS